MTFLGVALLTGLGSGLSLGSGELLCMGASVTYAICIILTNRLAQDDDPVVLGGLQVTFMGILGLVAAFLFESTFPAGQLGRLGFHTISGDSLRQLWFRHAASGPEIHHF